MATQSLQLGKSFRLFIGNTATPANDSTYTMVENENEITVSYTADTQEVSTKSAGKITLPGDEAYEVKFDFNEAFTDAGFELLEDAKNQSWSYQIRDVSGGADTVWVEGTFILTDLEYKAGTQGVREGSATLKNSNTVTMNRPPRALVLS